MERIKTGKYKVGKIGKICKIGEIGKISKTGKTSKTKNTKKPAAGSKTVNGSGRVWILSAMLWAMFCLTACSSRETVLLEEDDLVWTEEAQDRETGGEFRLEAAPSGTPGTAGGPGSESAGAGTAPSGTGGAEDGLESTGQAGMSTLFVHICGEVVKPGVYELPEGSRIFDAVEAAGGFTQDASESYVNLAQVLADGWKVEIPGAGAVCNAGPGSMAGITGNTADMGGNAGAGDGLVDINTATKQELCTLPGVGESRAESIISYRERNGGFERIEDIMKVEGIKEGMFSKMKDKICVRGGK